MPAVVFDNLTPDQVVELFVTINSKHTKLNPSHLISLAGRRLYRDDNLAAAHDVIRTLNEDEGSPLKGSIKVLGIGKGTRHPGVARRRAAGRLRGHRRGRRPGRPGVPRERPPLLPQLLQGRGPGLPDGVRRPEVLDQELDRPCAPSSGSCPTSSPWSASAAATSGRPESSTPRCARGPTSIGDRRFETETVWKEKLTGGTRSAVEILARELRQGLNT